MTFQATVVQEKLEEAGFDAKLAFGLTAVLERNVVAEAENRFVTREYLDARLEKLRAELKSDIAEVRAQQDTLRGQQAADTRVITGEIAALRAEMQGEIAALRAEMQGSIAALRGEMIKWFVGIMGGTALAVLLGLLRLAR